MAMITVQLALQESRQIMIPGGQNASSASQDVPARRARTANVSSLLTHRGFQVVSFVFAGFCWHSDLR